MWRNLTWNTGTFIFSSDRIKSTIHAGVNNFFFFFDIDSGSFRSGCCCRLFVSRIKFMEQFGLSLDADHVGQRDFESGATSPRPEILIKWSNNYSKGPAYDRFKSILPPPTFIWTLWIIQTSRRNELKAVSPSIRNPHFFPLFFPF